MIVCKKCIISIIVLLASGCTGVSTTSRPDSYYAEADLAQTASLPVSSLFSSDSDVLSDEDIRRIIAHRYKPQNQNRIGVITTGQNYWYGWSDELARAGSDVQSRLIDTLRASPLIYDASYLPSLLVPEKKTVGHYREAASRYQADLLLTYRASCRTYEKYRFLSPDKSRSYCNIEAVLLDTRTGIVPFTTLVSRGFSALKSESDLNIRETMRKAELAAVSEALEMVGKEVAGFLSGFHG